MSIRLSPQEWLGWPETQAVLAAFARAGVEARFVGGCVRDALLGRPVKDIDLATPAPPDRVMALLKNAGIQAIPTGLAHGTVTAVSGKKHFEITTLRRDVACDGRRAEVAFTDDWRQDAARRDFTLNALYASPAGEVTDFFGGAQDARNGRIAFIGDPRQRIREDALRILRFFRFWAHYGIPPPDAAALDACRALKEMIEELSGERIQQEMFRLLVADDPSEAVALMRQTRVLEVVMGGRCDPHALPALIAAERQAGFSPNALRRLALLLRQGEEPPAKMMERVRRRWKLSNQDGAALGQWLDLAQRLTPDWPEAEQKKRLRRAGKETFINAALLRWAELPQDAQRCAAMLALAASWEPPVFPLSGQDLLDAGFKPDPRLGEALRSLEAYWEAQDYRPGKGELLKAAEAMR